MPRTQEEIEQLKRDWNRDPCWDIEGTVGFEEHREELLMYRLRCKAEADADLYAEKVKKAEAIGCPGNIELAEYVMGLEYRLDRLKEEVRELQGY